MQYGIPASIQRSVTFLLDVALNMIGVSQLNAGSLGFVTLIVTNLCALLLGFFSDMFKRRIKLCVISFYSISLVAFTVFMCIYRMSKLYSNALLWTTYIISAIVVWDPSPIFYELAAEVNYPVAEGISHGFIAWLNKLVELVYLGIFAIPSIGTAWINWSLLVSLLIAIPLMCLFAEHYTRLAIDTQEPHSG